MDWPPENDPTNPDATPSYEGAYFFGGWTAYDWMTWHKAMSAEYGLTYANTTLVDAWNNTPWFDGVPMEDGAADNDFVNYFRNAGIYESMRMGILGTVVRGIGNLLEGGVNVTSGARDATGGLQDATKLLGQLLPAALVVGLVILALHYGAPALKEARKALK